jgi:hypothetical membrane protein
LFSQTQKPLKKGTTTWEPNAGEVTIMSKFLKFTGLVGLITPVLVFACILGAVVSWSSFSWLNNALSDLGVQWGVAATLFNFGLVVGGFLLMIFAAGLLTFLGKRLLGKVGVCLFLVACMALVGIGVFNETFSPTHYIVSVMLFVFMPVALLVFVGALWLEGKRNLGLLTLALGLIAAAPWVLEFTVPYVSGVAVPEFVSGLAGAVWTMALAYLMLKEPEKADSS